MGHLFALQAADLQEPMRHQGVHIAADSSSSQAILAVLQAAGSAKRASATLHCRLKHTEVCGRTITCLQAMAGPAFCHLMLQTAVCSCADQHLLVTCRPRQAQHQERLRHHALQIADEDFTVRHVDSPLQGQACFSGFDYTLNPYQVGLVWRLVRLLLRGSGSSLDLAGRSSEPGGWQRRQRQKMM